jgi:hypothetical protein
VQFGWVKAANSKVQQLDLKVESVDFEVDQSTKGGATPTPAADVKNKSWQFR